MSEMPQLHHGTPVVPGIGYAPVTWVTSPEPPATDFTPIPEGEEAAELQRFREAAQAVSQRLMQRSTLSVGTPSDILMMASALALDPGLDAKVKDLIEQQHYPAANAVWVASNEFVDQVKLAGGLLAERCTDIIDMRNRVIAQIQGEPEPGIPTLVEPSVLCAHDLAPADTAGLDPTFIRAIATVAGGPTSHTSIIARQLGIPCVVAVRSLDQIEGGQLVLVDGRTGRVQVNPDEDEARRAVELEAKLRERTQAWTGPAHTKDGAPVALMANVQDEPSARKAKEAHAQGVGLFRTELSFLNTQQEPSIEKQCDTYRRVIETFTGSKVVVRTLDAGSDKPVAWVSTPDEDNPALGVRGLRTNGVHADVLPHQLEAIAQAARGHEDQVWVMAPMVSTVAEAHWFADLVRGFGLKAGIMVEVPAVAVMAETFLKEVDFVSIGTNDLTQYVMAADRMNSNLASYTDPWQPAVLRLIDATARAGVAANKPVGICGEAAADPLLACVFAGMGISYLSMAAPALASVGVTLESVTMSDCQAAARRVLSEAVDASHARRIAEETLAAEGLL